MRHRHRWRPRLGRRLYLWVYNLGFVWRIRNARTWEHYAETGDCAYGCGYTDPYGFVPEADCPVHDRKAGVILYLIGALIGVLGEARGEDDLVRAKAMRVAYWIGLWLLWLSPRFAWWFYRAVGWVVYGRRMDA